MELNADQFPEQVQTHDLQPGDRIHMTVGDPMGLSSHMFSGRFLRADRSRVHLHVDGNHAEEIQSVKHEHVRSVFRG